MPTELQFSIIYPSHTENDINNFDFFIRVMRAEDRNIVSVVSVPKFSIDSRVVKHIHFSLQTNREVRSSNMLSIIAQLKELENIVSNIELTTEDATYQLKMLMLTVIEHLEKE